MSNRKLQKYLLTQIIITLKKLNGIYFLYLSENVNIDINDKLDDLMLEKIELEELFTDKKPLDTYSDSSIKEDKLKYNLVKKWFILFHNSICYGPYDQEEIINYLSGIKKNNLINDQDFLIADSESDFYFKPDSLLEILKEEFIYGIEKQSFSVENKKNKSEFKQLKQDEYFETINKVYSDFNLTKIDQKFNYSNHVPILQLTKFMNSNFIGSEIDVEKNYLQRNINRKRFPENKYSFRNKYIHDKINSMGILKMKNEINE